MKTMYPAQANSPGTELAVAISATTDPIALADASVIPDGPNLLTIGTDDSAETIMYMMKIGNELFGVTRGFQGVARSWASGTKVARNLTAYDIDTMRENLEGVSSGTINKIAPKPIDDIPADYQEGMSVFSLSSSEAAAWATVIGHVVTLDRALVETKKVASNYSIAQKITFIKDLANTTEVSGVYERVSIANNKWGPWVKVVSRSEFDTFKDATTAQLAERAINVKHPPAPLVAPVVDGVTNDTAVIQAIIELAKTNKVPLYFPAGRYSVTGLTIYGNMHVFGAGGSLSEIVGSDTVTPVFKLTGDPSRAYVHDLFINRTSQATGPNADGLRTDTIGELFTFERVWFRNHYNGLNIAAGSAGGWVKNCYATNNLMNGFKIADPNITLSECHSNYNGAHGYFITAVNGNSGMFMIKCEAFRNNGRGIFVQGVTGKVISDIIINNCIVSYNKGNGIHIDSYSSSITLVNNFVEYSGIEFGTNATVNEFVVGIALSPNNANVKLNGNESIFNALHGIQVQCPFSSTDDLCFGNSFNAPGNGHGISILSGVNDFQITGGRFAPLTGYANSQGYGIFLTGPHARFTITGADCKGSTGNVSGTIFYGSGLTEWSVANTRGANPRGVLAGPAVPATGGTITNNFGVPVRVVTSGGTGITLSVYSVPVPNGFVLYPGEILQINYATAPTWQWLGM